MSSLYFLISSLFYNLLVTIIYFHKERIKTKENKIYSLLIIINLIGIIIDMSSVTMARLGIHNALFFIINKVYSWRNEYAPSLIANTTNVTKLITSVATPKT